MKQTVCFMGEGRGRRGAIIQAYVPGAPAPPGPGAVPGVVPVPLLSLHDEAKPLVESLEWLERHCRDTPLGETTLCRYHRLIYPARDDAGLYRTGAVSMAGSSVHLPPPARVPSLIQALDARLAGDQRAWDAAPPAWP
jgi:hypothetical protein